MLTGPFSSPPSTTCATSTPSPRVIPEDEIWLFGIGASCRPSGCGLSVVVFSEPPLSGSGLFGIGELGIGEFGIGLERSVGDAGFVRKTSRSVNDGGRR